MTFGLPFVPAVGLALLLLAGCSRSDAQTAPPPPPKVSVVTLSPEQVTLSSEWIATLDGFVNAQVRSQVTGYLVKRNYGEGLAVKKGQVLFEIDPRPFQAAVAQAAAQVAQVNAELAKAGQDLARSGPLVKEGVAPQSQLDNAIQSKLAAEAAVQSAEATRAIARLNLGFTQVRSLVDGIAAIATAQIGDLVSPGTLLTTVSQVDPMKAYFSLSEEEYLRIAPRINRPEAPKTLWQSGTPLKLIMAGNTEYPHPGSFLAADREIDPKTGTIRISAAFPNPDHLLRPGQFGRIRAETEVIDKALLVPARAVTELQGRALVRVVGDDRKIAIRTVTLGKVVGNRRLVERGLEPNARVVIDAPALAEGTLVNPHPASGTP